jgi:hypothetical protein
MQASSFVCSLWSPAVVSNFDKILAPNASDGYQDFADRRSIEGHTSLPAGCDGLPARRGNDEQEGFSQRAATWLSCKSGGAF